MKTTMRTPSLRGVRGAISAIALSAIALGGLVGAAVSTAGAAVYATYRVTTDVSARTSPTAAPGAGYGIPNGGSFGVQCQVIGQPVGPRGNTLYFYALYQGRSFYVPDTWTTSPHLAGQPPIAGIPMCGAKPAPAPKPPSGTYASRDRQLRLCTNTGNAGCVPSGMSTVSRYASVKMVCWEKGSPDTGDYTTDMWFWITSPRGEGYVTASVIRNQTSVPACSTKRAFVAAEAALARYNQTTASATDQQLFASWEWKPGPTGEWAGDCPKLPYVAWRAAGVTVPKQNAIANYSTWRARHGGALPTSALPRGAIAFWNITSYGHTAVGVGDGFVATTSGMDFSGARNTVRRYTDYANYLGWVMPG